LLSLRGLFLGLFVHFLSIFTIDYLVYHTRTWEQEHDFVLIISCRMTKIDQICTQGNQYLNDYYRIKYYCSVLVCFWCLT
jgi:hypothetical protein